MATIRRWLAIAWAFLRDPDGALARDDAAYAADTLELEQARWRGMAFDRRFPRRRAR